MKKRIASLLICIVFLGGVLLYSDNVNAQIDLFTEYPEKEIESDYQPPHPIFDDQPSGGWGGYYGKNNGSGVHVGSTDFNSIMRQEPYKSMLDTALGRKGGTDDALYLINIVSKDNPSFKERLKALSIALSFDDSLFTDTIGGIWGEFIDYLRGSRDDIISWFEEHLRQKKEKEMKNPGDVGCYKPNIYVYSDSERLLSVQFEYPELLTKTIPEYGTGWFVTTAEDTLAESCLTDSEGRKYDYLFYESVSSKILFQTKEGYLISADRREEEFRRILSDMRFNEQEINDFCEFWTDKLEDDVDYVMYPQNTDMVNNAMPIVINPQPEKLERIWFLFEEDYGQSFVEPNPYVLDRDGNYTVIEWGGLY